MTLAELHTLIRANVGRGTALNTEIRQLTKQAALLIERNHSFAYMEKFGAFTIDYTSDDPEAVALPSRLKSIRFVRIVADDGAYTELERIDAHDMSALGEGTPTAYWMDGESNIIINATPTENINYQIQWYEFTDWPSDTSETPWLCKWAPDLLVAETLILIAALTRDPNLRMIYAQQRDEAMKTALILDDEMRYTPDRRTVMQFHPTRIP